MQINLVLHKTGVRMFRRRARLGVCWRIQRYTVTRRSALPSQGPLLSSCWILDCLAEKNFRISQDEAKLVSLLKL